MNLSKLFLGAAVFWRQWRWGAAAVGGAFVRAAAVRGGGEPARHPTLHLARRQKVQIFRKTKLTPK